VSQIRADQLLVQLGLAPTRSAAQRLIKAGAVLAQGRNKPIAKAGELLELDTTLTVSDDAELRYVSRGGLKLEGALRHCGWAPLGWQCLDIGSSTGGFADCLLQGGAINVLGVDVGHDQLHERLRNDPRMVNLEGINARALSRQDFPKHCQDRRFDLTVIDVSFISLRLVLPPALSLLEPNGRLLALVKPQFELGNKALTRMGQARSPQDYELLRQTMEDACKQAGGQVSDYFSSAITGQDGNHEFFLAATKR
jgi:23S rRNA (cytidine1920-2'-O)/16S rRNA (cytidine1409-2'-O)-methyltransferase